MSLKKVVTFAVFHTKSESQRQTVDSTWWIRRFGKSRRIKVIDLRLLTDDHISMHH